MQVLHQMRQIGALGFLDQLAGQGRIETYHVQRHFLHLFRLTGMMVGHAERIPGVSVHRLQSPRLFQRLGGLLMPAERAKGKPIGWTATEDWKDTQDLLSTFAKLSPQSDLNVYFTNQYLSDAPYMPKK